MGDALKSTVMEVSDTSATAASDLHESPPAPTAAPGSVAAGSQPPAALEAFSQQVKSQPLAFTPASPVMPSFNTVSNFSSGRSSYKKSCTEAT